MFIRYVSMEESRTYYIGTSFCLEVNHRATLLLSCNHNLMFYFCRCNYIYIGSFHFHMLIMFIRDMIVASMTPICLQAQQV
jgi:hypothetical protein